jgi:hypothetical protein
VELLWVLVLAIILIGPIVWAFTKGRRAGAPREDERGLTVWAHEIKERISKGPS